MPLGAWSFPPVGYAPFFMVRLMKSPAKCRRLDGAKSSSHQSGAMAQGEPSPNRTYHGRPSESARRPLPLLSPHAPDLPAGFCELAWAYLNKR